MTDQPADNPEYRVLARKYRPATFDALLGQDAMVRILKNAFEADRIAHAFILTGVRGVGKTTTARIIAKGLNCVGKDGKGGATIDPCGECEPCLAIAQGRHVDVLEMDAASRTGVNDIREIIDSVHYRAASARYKIYVIDEVHMLSTSAFNALLKTLEEPPAHVKFIFATTEIRKIPVTVLSRCQRFDLRRIEPDVMIKNLQRISKLENAKVSKEGLALITRAAEGSVRDALSLLDQAIAHGGGETSAAQVRAMLGLADRGRVLDLFDLIMQGDAAGALAELSAQYSEGADPMAVLRDLAEITHWTSVIKINADAASDPAIGPEEQKRGMKMAAELPMRVLSRMWQMLLRSLEDVAAAPNAMMAAEMSVIRLTHVAELPTPADLIKSLDDPADPVPPSGGGKPTASRPTIQTEHPAPGPAPVSGGGGGVTALAVQPATQPGLARFATFAQVADLIRANRDMKLLVEVEDHLRLAKYSPGRIEFEMTASAPKDLAPRLASRLQSWTGVRWFVSVVTEGGGQTLGELNLAKRNDLHALAAAHPMVQAVMQAFTGAEIRDIKTSDDTDNAALDPVEPEDEDDWDPFERD